MPTRDIENREDIELLVSAFYQELLQDAEMQHIFLEVASIDLNTHMPRLVDFWEQVLFHTGSYQGNPMEVHLDLHQQYPLQAAHFRHWLETFTQITRQMFSGPRAQMAIERARSIAHIMQMKINNLEQLRKEWNN